MPNRLMNQIDAGDIRAMAWAFCAASTLVMGPALRFDWFLVGGILAFLQTNQNIAAYALGMDLLPWAASFTLVVGACAAAGLWLATRATRGNENIVEARPSFPSDRRLRTGGSFMFTMRPGRLSGVARAALQRSIPAFRLGALRN